MGMRQPYSWMMKSVCFPVCSLWVHSGGTLITGIGELTKPKRYFVLVDPNLISMVTIPR